MKKSYILGLVILIVGFGVFIYSRTQTRVSPSTYSASSTTTFPTSHDIILNKITPTSTVFTEGRKAPRNETRRANPSSSVSSQQSQTDTYASSSLLKQPEKQAGTTTIPTDISKLPVATSTDVSVSTTYPLYVASTSSDSNTDTEEAVLETITHTGSVDESSTAVHITPDAYHGNVSTNVSGTTPTNDSKLPVATSTSVTVSTTHHLYVASTGSDSNPGTQEAPFKTITHAGSVAEPSTTIHVAPGTYYDNVLTNVSGTATNRIRYQSDIKWGAKIVGNGTEGMWTNNGDYTDIVDFDITGPGSLGILNNGSYTTIAGNHVHNLTISDGCTSNGGAGIVNANYSATDNDIIGNVVHDIGVPGACNRVQGIYHSNLRGHIYNNIVYRVSAWGIHLWHAANNVTIANNTVFANGTDIMGGGIIIGSGDNPGGVVIDNTKIINNIVYDNPYMSIEEYCYSGVSCIGSHNTVSNNLVYGNGVDIYLKVGSSTGTISDDPQFVDYQANGTGDYHLKSASPAIDKGVSAGISSVDIDNTARPLGANVDIGAYENR